ncbi:MAG: choice-of-anchor J domain-containing protein, partial [Bacteroidetes bacterium]|nr:choice-of-anchor J domain-containing protein [Bacteroidota bacterium]
PAEQYMKPHSGSRLGCCFSSMPPANPNNKWLISPRLSLGTSSMLDLWVETYNLAYGLERYNIAVSLTDNNPSSFVNLNTTYETADTMWTHRYYDLKDYNNKTVYVAIQCVSDNQFIFMIDDIHISSLSGIDDERSGIRVSVYPNPAHEFINFSIEMPFGTRIKAELSDMLGKGLRSAEFVSGVGSAKMDIHDLNPGVYSLLIYSDGSRLVQKVVIK